MTDDIGDSALQRILERAAERVTKINETTRNTIREALHEGVQAGEGMAQLGDRIAESAAFDRYRGELIARTETMFAWNASSIESYRGVGVQWVEPMDGDKDEECIARLMRGAVPLDEAMADEDHPNGTLAWSPVIDAFSIRNEIAAGAEKPSIEDIDATVDRLVNNATAVEKRTTADILNVGERSGLDPNTSLTFHDGKTVHTLDFRLKTVDSTFRKVTGELQARPLSTLREIEGSMRDNLRYTFTTEPGNYTAGVRAATEDLIARGYNPARATDYWASGKGYAGLNTNWTTPEGQIFELQFHTPEGLRLKEVFSHPLYEKQRLLVEKSPEWNALQEQIDDAWSAFRESNSYDFSWLDDYYRTVRR